MLRKARDLILFLSLLPSKCYLYTKSAFAGFRGLFTSLFYFIKRVRFTNQKINHHLPLLEKTAIIKLGFSFFAMES